ncbi:MAG: VWA domain-containing protein [Lachnospiraceae bacterium]|nr:VWA domain-containing protein [Lachnospiraceae bacterium]
MTGCGSADGGSNSGAATAAADAGSEAYAPASDGAASDNAGYAYGAAEAEADADYGDYTNGIKGMETQSATATDGYLESCYDYDDDSAYFNTEEYSQWEEQGFSSVLKAPLSTFAADVDTASYSNLRRLINSGYGLDELPQGAARIEEMINYFSYDYNAPKGMEPFGVTTQISECPWNDDAKLLMIGLKTEDIDYSQAPPSNLVFLLDVSGSMYSYDKLPLLQESFGLLAENLTKKDRVSIVTYAGDDRIVLDGVRGDETDKIIKALKSLEAGGGTYGSKGIETAYKLAEENYIEGGNNRIILATDGDLNIGLTSEEELEELITEKKESGIFLSVLGFGTGNIKDNKMETLADKGNGNYAYIDSLREANKVLVEEMTATLLTICKDVKFQVEFNPEVVESYRLLGYENRALAKEDFNDDTKDAGEIGAGHSVTALYEIVLTDPNYDMAQSEIEDLKYKEQYKKMLGKQLGTADVLNWEDIKDTEWLTISIRYKKPAEDESNLLQYPVGSESYTNNPGDDFVFAAAVAEFGLLASHSEYPEDASVKHVEKALKSIDLSDEYKEEFLELVRMVK